MSEVRTLSVCAGCGVRVLRDVYHACPLTLAAAKADPQAHIDALVEAGVLERRAISAGVNPDMTAWNDFAYRVVQPHVHSWTVDPISDMLHRFFSVRCSCGETRGARFIEEVPND